MVVDIEETQKHNLVIHDKAKDIFYEPNVM